MTDAGPINDLIAELDWRGFIKDCTDRDGLKKHLKTKGRKIYCGFDPTSESLTIGNLVPIMMLAHAKRAGHTPIVVSGGGTGLIGDPSGKSAERQMMTKETVEHNVSCQRVIFENVIGNVEGTDYEILNNLDWLAKISYIDALRDIGKHFSVNMMMQKESVKERLNNREQGISYTEFSYMILQAYDFAHLYEHEGVTVQFGGSDQYGNIIAGSDLIRRKSWELLNTLITARTISEAGHFMTEDDEKIELSERELRDTRERAEQLLDTFVSAGGGATHDTGPVDGVPEFVKEFADRYTSGRVIWKSFGLTAPLVKKADGTKFGKTESGAVWLTAAYTSPYVYYQFWLNASDDDARDWIKIFTFMPKPEIDALIAEHDENPGRRALQRTLAQHATTILHGQAEMLNAEAAAKALFSGDIASLDEKTLTEVFANIPSSEHSAADLDDGVDMVGVLKETGLASSNREARDFLSEGSVSINGTKIDPDSTLTRDHLLHGSLIAIRRGKKKWHLTRWS